MADTRTSSREPGADRWCRSRRGGALCTREAGHAGLHRRDGILWADAGADAPHCTGSGRAGEPARVLADRYPGGRALCPVCLGFVPLDAGRLADHDSWAGDANSEEAAQRREWFNTIGW